MNAKFSQWFSAAWLIASFYVVPASSAIPELPSQSSSALLNSGNETPVSNQALANGTYMQENRNNLLLPGETDVRQLLPTSGEAYPPPYGANLFAGGYETERSDGLNDNYLVAAGDKINIWLWGAVNYSSVVTVDNQGNIFIPEVGPIQVQDVAASKLNAFVTSKIKKIYTNNVSIYVNLLTATPVSVYLSGPVIRPGQYAGMASDSVLYYLKRAGGIDPERGSYREIAILRDGKTLASIDLYDFIRNGALSDVSFKDEDVILVKPQKAAITVAGGVRNPFRFELNDDAATGSELSDISRPLAKISHVGVVGNRRSGPFSSYITLDEFQQFELQDGDKVLFNDDSHAQVIDVQVSGSYLGPSQFAVKNSARLHDVLSYIPVDPELSDFKNVYILRTSVAQQQKQILEDSLNRLERSVLTNTASSSGEVSIRAQEAQMVMQFVEKAKLIQPQGKVVVADNGQVANILLEQGDLVVIPAKTDLIQIGGEVLMPQAVVYNQNATMDDYIAWVGGFTERADDERIALLRANGLVEFNSAKPIQRGDQILVLPKVEIKTMQAVQDVTQIIYQMAYAYNKLVD